MGIYLPNIEMPRKGEMLVIFPDGTSYVCFNGMRERLNHTTAFSVPPHGRLIDADAIRADIDEKRPGRSYEDAWALTVLDSAPTILEAEEGE